MYRCQENGSNAATTVGAGGSLTSVVTGRPPLTDALRTTEGRASAFTPPALRSLALMLSIAGGLGCSAASGSAPVIIEGDGQATPSPRQEYLEGEVTLHAGDESWTVARSTLGARVRAGDEGAQDPQGPQARQSETAVAAPTHGPWPFEPTVNDEEVDRQLEQIRRRVARDARPGRLDFERRVARAHVTARALDVNLARAALVMGLLDGRASIVLPVIETPPEEGVVPEGLALTAVLAEYQSDYFHHGGGAGRRVNVETATRAIHGKIIEAGGVLSFNQSTGPRTYSRGYRRAPVILDAELVPGMGGGVCQVASTLHAAAFHAGLEMEEYRPHSRPSGYVPTGLDATVNWPHGDLVVRNPFDFPVAVRAWTDGVHVNVQLYGQRAPRQVELRTELFRRGTYRVRHADNPALDPGETEVAQRGRGMRTVYRTRIITEDGRTWEEQDRLVYPPVPKVIHHGPTLVAAAPDASSTEASPAASTDPDAASRQ